MKTYKPKGLEAIQASEIVGITDNNILILRDGSWVECSPSYMFHHKPNIGGHFTRSSSGDGYLSTAQLELVYEETP